MVIKVSLSKLTHGNQLLLLSVADSRDCLCVPLAAWQTRNLIEGRFVCCVPRYQGEKNYILRNYSTFFCKCDVKTTFSEYPFRKRME